PMFPSLYVTDITGLDPNSVAAHMGDWQYGGSPIPPDNIFGAWKAFTKTIDLTGATPKITLTADPNPSSKNGFNLGPGSDPVPAGTASLGFGLEARWNISDLGLIPGH